MADPEQPQKTDPRLRFDLFKKAEGRLLNSLQEHEREIKRLMAELETIRNLLDEASDDIEDKEVERLQKEHDQVEKQRRALEEVVNESAEMRRENEQEQEAQELPDNYTPITSQRLTMAASYSTRQELYELQEKEEWTPGDAYRFFEISNAIQTTQQYNFSTPIQENINQTYEIMRNVAEQQQNQIEMNYNPSMAEQVQTYQTPTSNQQTAYTTIPPENRTFSPEQNTLNTTPSANFSENYSTLDRQLDSNQNPTQNTTTNAMSSSNNNLDSGLKEKYKPNKPELDEEK